MTPFVLQVKNKVTLNKSTMNNSMELSDCLRKKARKKDG